MKPITLYGTSSKGKLKEWTIWTEGGYVCRRWGFCDGEKQETQDLVERKNKGKANETSLEEQANLEAERILKKKRDEGYVESIKELSKEKKLINWETAEIDTAFAPSKPQVSIEPEDEAELVASGNAWYQRKWNGQRAFVIKGTTGKVNIYSRRLELKTDLFPNHVDIFEATLPNGTIIDCECIANDDVDLIKTIFGADAEKAIERQKETDVTFIIFDLLYLDCKSCVSMEYQHRYKLLEDSAIDLDNIIQLVENISKDELQPEWEGLILRDKTAPMKIRTDGKPDRKSGSWKKKNFKECDVVAYEWKTGKGKNNDRPAKLLVGAYDAKGKFVHISEVGSGLCESHKDEILSGKVKLPVAIEIKYEEVTPEKSFRLPVFLRFRAIDDKAPKECLLSEIKGYYDSGDGE